MGQIALSGANRVRLLNDVRNLRVFNIGPAGKRVTLSALYIDEASTLAWIECNMGTFRLPSALFSWALVVEDRARDVVGHDDVFPCRAVFEELRDGSMEVEIFPEGYNWR